MGQGAGEGRDNGHRQQVYEDQSAERGCLLRPVLGDDYDGQWPEFGGHTRILQGNTLQIFTRSRNRHALYSVAELEKHGR